MSRKGFSLVELLVAMITIPTVMWVMTLMTRTLVMDMPRDRRVVNEQLQVDQVLKQLQADMDQALSLPAQWQNVVRDANTLILEQTQGMVVYRHQGRLIVRSSDNDPNNDREWTLPYAHMTWTTCSLTEELDAIEVECFVPLKNSKGVRQHFKRNYLYVPGGLTR